MLKLGYSQEEIQSAFNQIFHLSYAPFSDHSNFPLVRINSFIDFEIPETSKLYKEYYNQNLNGVDIRYDPAGYFRGQPNPFLKVPLK